jgi:hypothetical protein
LKHIWKVWDHITLHDQDIQKAADIQTVQLLQLRVPSLSKSDRSFVKTIMESGLLFPSIDDVTIRERILQAVLEIDCLIPSIKTMHKNLKYLEVGAKVLKSLIVSKSPRPTIYHALRSAWTCTKEPFVETSHRRAFIGSALTSEIVWDIVYKQVWIWALRNFSELGGRGPRKERSRPSHNPTLDPQVHFEFAKLAKDLGISTRKIESRLENDPRRERLWESMHQMYPSLTETEIDKMVAALMEQLPPVRSEDLSKGINSHHHETGVVEDLSRRWGVPFLDTYNTGKDMFFLANISSKANLAHHPMPNTLFILQDFIISFFGKIPEFEIGEEFDFDSAWKGKKRLSHAGLNSTASSSPFNNAGWNIQSRGDPEHNRPNIRDTSRMDIDSQDMLAQSGQLGQDSMEEDEETPNSKSLFESSRRSQVMIGKGGAPGPTQENHHSSVSSIPQNRVSDASTSADNVDQEELSDSTVPIEESRAHIVERQLEEPRDLSMEFSDPVQDYRSQMRSVISPISSSDSGSTHSSNQSTYQPTSVEEIFREASRSPVLSIGTLEQTSNQEMEPLNELVTQWKTHRSDIQLLGGWSNIEGQTQGEDDIRDLPRMSFVHPELNSSSQSPLERHASEFRTSQVPSRVDWSEQGLISPGRPSNGLVSVGRSPVISLESSPRQWNPNERQYEQQNTTAHIEQSNEGDLASSRLDDMGVAKDMPFNLQGPPGEVALLQTLQSQNVSAPNFDDEGMEDAPRILDHWNTISPPGLTGDNDQSMQEEPAILDQWQSEDQLFQDDDSDQSMDDVAQPVALPSPYAVDLMETSDPLTDVGFDIPQYARRSMPLPLPHEQPPVVVVNVTNNYTQNILVSCHRGIS